MLVKTGKPLFPLGQVVATPGAIEAFKAAGQSLADTIRRHHTGDWGDMEDDDKALNDAAIVSGYIDLESGDRVFSAYNLTDGTKVWIITEADRSSTCVLLPSEYRDAVPQGSDLGHQLGRIGRGPGRLAHRTFLVQLPGLVDRAIRVPERPDEPGWGVRGRGRQSAGGRVRAVASDRVDHLRMVRARSVRQDGPGQGPPRDQPG